MSTAETVDQRATARSSGADARPPGRCTINLPVFLGCTAQHEPRRVDGEWPPSSPTHTSRDPVDLRGHGGSAKQGPFPPTTTPTMCCCPSVRAASNVLHIVVTSSWQHAACLRREVPDSVATVVLFRWRAGCGGTRSRWSIAVLRQVGVPRLLRRFLPQPVSRSAPISR